MTDLLIHKHIIVRECNMIEKGTVLKNHALQNCCRWRQPVLHNSQPFHNIKCSSSFSHFFTPIMAHGYAYNVHKCHCITSLAQYQLLSSPVHGYLTDIFPDVFSCMIKKMMRWLNQILLGVFSREDKTMWESADQNHLQSETNKWMNLIDKFSVCSFKFSASLIDESRNIF